MSPQFDTVVGPFSQILTLDSLPKSGAILGDSEKPLENTAIAFKDGVIAQLGSFDTLKDQARDLIHLKENSVLLPGFVDCHTHICFWGQSASRLRLAT